MPGGLAEQEFGGVLNLPGLVSGVVFPQDVDGTGDILLPQREAEAVPHRLEGGLVVGNPGVGHPLVAHQGAAQVEYNDVFHKPPHDRSSI